MFISVFLIGYRCVDYFVFYSRAYFRITSLFISVFLVGYRCIDYFIFEVLVCVYNIIVIIFLWFAGYCEHCALADVSSSTWN